MCEATRGQAHAESPGVARERPGEVRDSPRPDVPSVRCAFESHDPRQMIDKLDGLRKLCTHAENPVINALDPLTQGNLPGRWH